MLTCFSAKRPSLCSIEGKLSRHRFSPAAAQPPINMVILQGCVLAMFASDGLPRSRAALSLESVLDEGAITK